MRECKEEIIDFLVNSLNTSQLDNLARDFSPAFNLRRESGFESRIAIPLRTAADTYLRFLGEEEDMLEFAAFLLTREGRGAGHGGLVHFQGKERLFRNLSNFNWIYNKELNRFEKDQSRVKTRDWGVLREGRTYFFTFASLDVVGSSYLIKNNDLKNVGDTLRNFKKFARGLTEEWNGRIWIWSGDGGLAVFREEETPESCLASMASILAYLPHFNIAYNSLVPECDLRIRIGVHQGPCVYQKDATLLNNEDIEKTHRIQETSGRPNTLCISRELYRQIRPEVGALFQPFQNEILKEELYIHEAS